MAFPRKYAQLALLVVACALPRAYGQTPAECSIGAEIARATTPEEAAALPPRSVDEVLASLSGKTGPALAEGIAKYTRTLMGELDRLTNRELEKEIQRWMHGELRERGYLPGLGREARAYRPKDLVNDLFAHPHQHGQYFGQVWRNLMNAPRGYFSNAVFLSNESFLKKGLERTRPAALMEQLRRRLVAGTWYKRIPSESPIHQKLVEWSADSMFQPEWRPE